MGELEKLKFEKAWACAILKAVRNELKKRGKVVGKAKRYDDVTWLQEIDMTLDNIGAEKALDEQEAKRKAEYAEWWIRRGYLFGAPAPKS